MVEGRSCVGYAFFCSEPHEAKMPRIGDQFLDCVIYLYPTVDAANAGMAVGGTGFLVGIPYKRAKGYSHRYAVTNSHVIRRGSPIVRLNTRDGKFDVLDIDPQAWIHHPDGDDVAVCPLSLPAEFYRYKMLPADKIFITKEIIGQRDIGPGDEAFFVGRFITHEGRQRNLPSARFGNIAMMPDERVRNYRTGLDQESFLVEARSLSGYSGSPVFVYISAFAHRPGQATTISSGGHGPWLLGIDWGHVAGSQPVLERDGETPVQEGWRVPQNSGMMAVVPAWKLAELLESQELVEMRQQREEQQKLEAGHSKTAD